MDTIGLRRRYKINHNSHRKETYEREMTQLEKDLEKLNKGVVYV